MKLFFCMLLVVASASSSFAVKKSPAEWERDVRAANPEAPAAFVTAWAHSIAFGYDGQLVDRPTERFRNPEGLRLSALPTPADGDCGYWALGTTRARVYEYVMAHHMGDLRPVLAQLVYHRKFIDQATLPREFHEELLLEGCYEPREIQGYIRDEIGNPAKGFQGGRLLEVDHYPGQENVDLPSIFALAAQSVQSPVFVYQQVHPGTPDLHVSARYNVGLLGACAPLHILWRTGHYTRLIPDEALRGAAAPGVAAQLGRMSLYDPLEWSETFESKGRIVTRSRGEISIITKDGDSSGADLFLNRVSTGKQGVKVTTGMTRAAFVAALQSVGFLPATFR